MPSTSTAGMWQMVSELLNGEKLPVSINKDIEMLCNSTAIVMHIETEDRYALINALKDEIAKLHERLGS